MTQVIQKDAAFKVLCEATQEIRKEYRTRYEEMEVSNLEWYRKGLAAVGMDANAFAPYPSSINLNRRAYQMARVKYNETRRYFAPVPTSTCRRMNDPEIVAEKPDAEAKLRKEARRAADALVDAYLRKMAIKIGKEIMAVQTNGRIWDEAMLTVTCVDGETQNWKTRCILNRSVLGKLFNQWPTRRQS